MVLALSALFVAILAYMKLTSLNLQGFTNWQQRESSIVSYLRQTSPDVIFLQEAVYLPEVSPFNTAQLLNRTVQYQFEHSSITRLQVGAEYPIFREGLSTLSRSPIVKTETIILKQASGDEHNRIIQLVDILDNHQIIKFANVHFSITDSIDFATAHLTETIEILKSRHEQRIIIGDFNLSSLDESKELWSHEYIASSSIQPYITYPSMNKRTDYVLIPKKYSFDHLEVSDDSLSDHRALTVTIGSLD